MKKRSVLTFLVSLALVLAGCPDPNKEEERNTDPKQITITNISGLPVGTDRVGIRVFQSYDEAEYDGNFPKNTALGHQSYSAQTELTFSLKTLEDNNITPSTTNWTGNGTYYIYFLPNNSSVNAKIYTGGGTEPVLYDINQAITTLDFSKFKANNLYR